MIYFSFNTSPYLMKISECCLLNIHMGVWMFGVAQTLHIDIYNVLNVGSLVNTYNLPTCTRARMTNIFVHWLPLIPYISFAVKPVWVP